MPSAALRSIYNFVVPPQRAPARALPGKSTDYGLRPLIDKKTSTMDGGAVHKALPASAKHGYRHKAARCARQGQ